MYCPKCGEFLLCHGKPTYHDEGSDILVEKWSNQKCSNCGTLFTCEKSFAYLEDEDEYSDIRTPINKSKPSDRGIRSRSRKIETPDCPHCHKRTRPSDMKYNGYDEDSNLFESYHCPHCGTRFSISFDGKDENSEWYYDMDSIESPSRKPVGTKKTVKTGKTSVKTKKAAKKPTGVIKKKTKGAR